jgi:glycosyltransferase involved in cell wall biosynthesis
MSLIILTTAYNCENYIEKCISTIMTQKHNDFRCFITDDMSTDGTVDKVKQLIQNDSRFTLIENTEKMYQPGNYDQVIRGKYGVDDNDICIEVDGDDWLPDSEVFNRIEKIYSDNKVWLANGCFKYHDGRMGFASPHNDFEGIRHKPFTLSHIRTWKAFLWKNIKVEDLKDENGKYWDVAGDLAFMFPMVEMSGIEHYRFMYDVNYVYNEENPLNDHKLHLWRVQQVNSIIRNYKPYEKL